MSNLRKSFLPCYAAICLLALSTINAHADGDAIKGESYYAVCAGCHGADAMGMEATSAPRLQGQHDWYLIRQINYFKTGVRGAHKDDKFGAPMRGMVATLPNDQAVKDVVAYIVSLK